MHKYLKCLFEPRAFSVGTLTFELVDDLNDFSGVINKFDVSRLNNQNYIECSKLINGFACFLVVLKDGNFIGAIPLHRTNLLRFSTGYTGVILAKSLSATKTREFFVALWTYFSSYSLLSFSVTEGFSSPSLSIKKLHTIYAAGSALHFINFIPVRFLKLSDFDSEQDLYRILPSKTRSQIKTSKTEGVDFRFNYLSEFDDSQLNKFILTYVSFMNKCRKETGVAPLVAKDLLNELKGCLLGGVDILVARASCDEQILSMCLFHIYGDVCLYFQGGSLSEKRGAALYGVLFSKCVIELSKKAQYLELGRIDHSTEKLRKIDRFKSNFSNEILFGCQLSYEPLLYIVARRFWRAMMVINTKFMSKKKLTSFKYKMRWRFRR